MPILPLRSVWVSHTAYLNAAHRTINLIAARLSENSKNWSFLKLAIFLLKAETFTFRTASQRSLPQQSSSRALPCPEVRREVRRRSRSSRERRRAASAVPPPLEGRRVGEGLSSGGGGIRVAWGRSGVDGATVIPLNRLGRGRLPLGSRRVRGQPPTRRQRQAGG